MSRLARLVERTTGRTAAEYDVTALTPAEIDDWYLRVVHHWDLSRFALVWPDHNVIEEG